jgi:predicted GNAT superfamily acetyltransferase
VLRTAHGEVLTDSLDVRLVDWYDRSYARTVDEVRRMLGAPNNPSLFPGHFLKATFPKMGGRIAVLHRGDEMVGFGFLFPRELRGGRRAFTMRLHGADSTFQTPPDAVAAAVAEVIGADVQWYDPTAPATYASSAPAEDGLVLHRPDARDARRIRELQAQIWHPNSPDALYPADLHALDFRPGTSLVARVDGGLAGFLFGFYKFDGAALPRPLAARYATEFCLESQLIGVLPGFRGRHVSVALKQKQAELAHAEGIHVVNWTFDPLQYANAHLNLGRLGGVGFDFYPNYYDFHNDLNVAPASRLMVTWLIDSARVGTALVGHGFPELDLGAEPDVIRLNRGAEVVASPNGARRVAIDIPANWTELQRDPARRDLALGWRKTTDEILGTWLGIAEGQYALTGTGREGDRCYLIGERLDEGLLSRLCE